MRLLLALLACALAPSLRLSNACGGEDFPRSARGTERPAAFLVTDQTVQGLIVLRIPSLSREAVAQV
jgi:hypothetical protein